jgi:hypothetical protein
MGFVKYTKPAPTRGGRRNAAPTINVPKSGAAIASQALVEAMQLDKFTRYDIYVDKERKLVGLDVDKVNGTYESRPCATSNRKKCRHLSVIQGLLRDLGCTWEAGFTIPVETGKHLPAPLLAQFSYAPYLPKRSSKDGAE